MRSRNRTIFEVYVAVPSYRVVSSLVKTVHRKAARKALKRLRNQIRTNHKVFIHETKKESIFQHIKRLQIKQDG